MTSKPSPLNIAHLFLLCCRMDLSTGSMMLACRSWPGVDGRAARNRVPMNEGRRDRDRQKRRLRNEGLENVFHKGILTSDPDFVEEVGLDGDFDKHDHWMDSMCAVPFFCPRCRVRVVFCCFHFAAVAEWLTDVCDARTGKMVDEHRVNLLGV
jgi:hypothetical protein